jgi:hypothetical protein
LGEKRNIRKLKRWGIVAAVLCAALCASFFLWKKGTPYQPPCWSPDGQYYVQKYSNYSLKRLLPGMPGQGSDAIDGYIRLYDKKGHLLAEGFHTFIRDIEPIWGNGAVFLKGIPSMDNDPWPLPKR